MSRIMPTTVSEVTDNITKNLILRHGYPKILLTDNGTQLRLKSLERCLAAFYIRHVYTSVHAPHCNPVEHTNRTIKIVQYVSRNHRN